MKNPLEGFHVVVPIDVAWGEMDALEHVNNAVYFRYFESSRIAYMDRAGLDELMKSGVGPVLAEIRCRFKAPVRYPDRVQVGTRMLSVEGDFVRIAHVVVSERLGRVAAEGDATLAFIDRKTQKKVPVPPEFLARLEAIERG